jgi:hypothetical protein
LVKRAAVIDCRLDHLHRLAFESIGDLLERPALLVLDCALDELLGQPVDLLAPLLVFQVDAVQFEAQRVGEDLLTSVAKQGLARATKS